MPVVVQVCPCIAGRDSTDDSACLPRHLLASRSLIVLLGARESKLELSFPDCGDNMICTLYVPPNLLLMDHPNSCAAFKAQHQPPVVDCSKDTNKLPYCPRVISGPNHSGRYHRLPRGDRAIALDHKSQPGHMVKSTGTLFVAYNCRLLLPAWSETVGKQLRSYVPSPTSIPFLT